MVTKIETRCNNEMKIVTKTKIGYNNEKKTLFAPPLFILSYNLINENYTIRMIVGI